MSKSSSSQPEPVRVPPSNLFLARMTFDGSPGGDSALVGDYSLAADEAWVQGPPGFVWHCHSLDFFLKGAGNVTANGYGPIAELVKGLELQVRAADDTVILGNILIKSTGDFQSIPGAVNSIESAGPGDNYLNVNWQIAQSVGVPVSLGAGMKMLAMLNDSFIGLTAHYITVAGYLTPAET